MADPLRHRQTKGAATDMVDLTPPRHIPTLPKLRFNVPFDVDVGPYAACLMPMVPRGSNVLSFRCARARLKAAPARLTIIDAVPPAGLTAVKLPR
jgi:hypothetical protein